MNERDALNQQCRHLAGVSATEETKQCVLQDEENHHWQDAVITSEQEDWSGRASWYLAVCWQAPVGCATLICTSAQEWIPRGLPCTPVPYHATSCLPKLAPLIADQMSRNSFISFMVYSSQGHAVRLKSRESRA